MSDQKSSRPSLDDYIDVAERIVKFNEKYPEGSLQTVSWETKDIAGQLFVVYHAAAYRTPNDERPGLGIAWEPFPGQTPYTRNSELMNAETAAWGRAVVAVGLVASKKLASKQEVRGRQGEDPPKKPPPPRRQEPRLAAEALAELRETYSLTGWSTDELRMRLTALGAPNVSDIKTAMTNLTEAQAAELRTAMNIAIDAIVAQEQEPADASV